MNEKSLLLSEAMGYIAEEYLEEAHPEISEKASSPRRRLQIVYRVALAACLCLVAVGTVHFALSSGEKFTNATKDEAIIPEADCPVNDGMASDVNDVGTVGTTAKSPEDSTAEGTEEESTTEETSLAEAETLVQSEDS